MFTWAASMRDDPLFPDGQIGLTSAEAAERLRRYGPNSLPRPRRPSFLFVFLRQFLSPLIYILLAAALVSIATSDLKDAAFIAVVLLLMGLIGAFQEFSAERATSALRDLEALSAMVLRDGKRMVVDSLTVVPGDVIFLDAGGQVPADVDLQSVEGLRCDEALLTGESRSVGKQAASNDCPDPHLSRA